MRLAETFRSRLWILAGAGIAAALALRPAHREVAAMPIVDIQTPHELTMSVDDDCASDVDVVNGRYVVTLAIPDRTECTKSVRVYHLENDHLVFERR
jgi:hypothetical protein